MKRKIVVARLLAIIILTALVLGYLPATTRAAGPGGSGPCPKWWRAEAGQVAGGQLDEQAAKLERELYRHKTELIAILAAADVDEEKARQVHKAITGLLVQLADRRFEQALDYKKKNPEWQPGFGRRGPGFMSGRGGRPFGP